MSINKVDYSTLDNGASTYRTQAQAIQDVISTIDSMNSELSAGWENQSATAFFNKYDTEHKPALMRAVEALENISDFIQKYSADRQDEDAKNAAQIGG